MRGSCSGTLTPCADSPRLVLKSPVFNGRRTFMSVQRIKPGARMSQAVIHGNTVYLAGLTADDTAQDVKGQTAQILAKIDALLAEAGTDKSKLLCANIWLT